MINNSTTDVDKVMSVLAMYMQNNKCIRMIPFAERLPKNGAVEYSYLENYGSYTKKDK